MTAFVVQFDPGMLSPKLSELYYNASRAMPIAKRSGMAFGTGNTVFLVYSSVLTRKG